jgi:hypothetical protein
MNDRIKELKSQCWNHRVNGALVDGQLHFDTEKFATLLVHECASIVENLSPGYDDYRNQIEDAFRRDAISEMKYILLGEEK